MRVELSRMTRAVIIGQDAEASGIIYDISEVVCAVYVRSANVHDFEPGSAVRFMTKLPDTDGGKSLEIDTMATVFKSYKQGKNDLKAYRMIIQYDNNPALRLYLANYISSRQREIVRELKELSEVIPDAEITEDSLTGEEKIAGILT
ncbi:MAG: hypothetical protein JSW20_05925 [Nitrospiraceae bacterium]|nr:MAG: hypothetical protein JSW20_05925 [Nitrospiraceae bacterium]